jgi:hypothetical protein
MANPATLRAGRERRRRRRLREERETNEPPPTDAEGLAALDEQRARIAAALDKALEKAQAKAETALAVPLDPALRALILESLLVEHRHHSGDEPMACALLWIDAVIRFMSAHAALLRGIDMTSVPALLIRALHDYRAGSPAILDAMIDNKPTGKGARELPSAAHERALIAAWVAVLMQGKAKSGAYNRTAALKAVTEELGCAGIARTRDAVRRNHQLVALDRQDSPDALQVYDAVLAAIPEEAREWPRNHRQRWLRRQVERAAGAVFRS